jgi:plastocyanin
MKLQQSLMCWTVLMMTSVGSVSAATQAVTVGGGASMSFSPKSITINAGDTVVFTNAVSSLPHNVVADDNSFRCANGCDGDGAGGNGNAATNRWTFSKTFNSAGTIRYYCEIHGFTGGVGMAGTITVNAATPTINLGGYLSGNWFIPSQGGGQGYQLEFTNFNNDMIAIWFAFTPAGSTANDGSGQNWIYAEGPYDTTKNTVTLPAILLAGARFPPNFHPADVHRVPNDASTWGTITFSFSDCNNGMVSWHSDLAGYNNANDTPVAIQRLTQIAGTTCPQ